MNIPFWKTEARAVAHISMTLLAESFLSNHLISRRLQKQTFLYSSVLKIQRFFAETKLIRFLDASGHHVSDQQI
jgi:hypothetical protein